MKNKKYNLFYPHVPVSSRNAARKVLDSRYIGQGPLVDKFEKIWYNKISKPHKAIAVGSGTDALHLAYILAGVKKGDNVVCANFTCTATTSPILYQGAKPVFADIKKDSLNIDPESVKKLINKKTKAISFVDYGGLPADIDELRKIANKWKIPLIEDACQAQGAKYKGKYVGSTKADFVCFSFQAIKILTTCDGGMLCIKDPRLEEKAKRIRWFGIDRKAKMEDRWKNDITELGYKYQCFTPDTEILTIDGFKPVEKITTKDIVATLNTNNREMIYSPVKKTWEYNHEGDIVVLEQKKRGISFSVTRDHIIWASTGFINKLRPFRADNLIGDARIPCSTNIWKGITPKNISFKSQSPKSNTIKRKIIFDSKDWAEFLGWYISEGYTSKYKNEISITQLNKDGRKKIEILLKRMGIHYQNRWDRFIFYNKEIFNYLHQLGTSNVKYIPKEIKNWDKIHLNKILVALIDGDGTWYDKQHKVGRFISSSRKLIDDVMEIGLKIGYKVAFNKSKTNPIDSKWGQKDRWYVHLTKREKDVYIRSHKMVDNKKQHQGTIIKKYKGKVYCITVNPHHTVAIRHNGKVSWIGQCTDFSAAMGIEAMKVLDKTLAHHRELFETYRNELKGIKDITFIGDDKDHQSSCWLATVLCDKRDYLKKELAKKNIESNQVHYRNDRYTIFGGRVKNCPNMDILEKKYLVLPMNYHLSVKDIKYICKQIRGILNG